MYTRRGGIPFLAGVAVVDLDGAMIGQITFTRETGHLRQAAGKAELGYLFLPEEWGRGFVDASRGPATTHPFRRSVRSNGSIRAHCVSVNGTPGPTTPADSHETAYSPTPRSARIECLSAPR